MTESKPRNAAPNAAAPARPATMPREGGSYVREKDGGLRLVERTDDKPRSRDERAKLAEAAARKTAAQDAAAAAEEK